MLELEERRLEVLCDGCLVPMATVASARSDRTGRHRHRRRRASRMVIRLAEAARPPQHRTRRP